MVFAEDAGTAAFSSREVESLRRYLLKGGFLFASDYWGTAAGEQLDEQMERVLPADKFPIVDIPMSHPVWHTMFDLKDVPQMASIQYWRRSGGGISERGADSDTVEVRGIADSHGRLMVLMVHNSDIPDGWGARRSGSGILRPFLAGCVQGRHRRNRVCDDPLRFPKTRRSIRADPAPPGTLPGRR